MKKFLMALCFLIASQSVLAYGEPQWNEFCPPEYLNAVQKVEIKPNPFAQVLLCYSIIGIPFAVHKSHKYNDAMSNNYWYRRKMQFDNEIAMCKQYSSSDGQLSCYMNIRQLEFNKTAQYDNLMMAQEQLRVQRLQYMEQAQTNSNLHSINNNLNYRRYGY